MTTGNIQKRDQKFFRPGDWLFVTVFVLFSIGFYVVKFFKGHWVEAWYAEGNFALLNKITGVGAPQTLGFYLGKSEEFFFGPILQILSGILLIALIWKFFKASKALVFGITVLGYLLLTRLEVLFFPPYGDAVGGPWVEALWLARHQFHYGELFHQPGYALGGPKVYLFSIYPTFIAAMMKILPWPKLFLVVNHLLVFGMAAAIVAVVREILLRWYDQNTAGLGAMLLLFLPVFQSQTEALNMELGTLFFAVLACHFLILKRIHWAGLMAVLSVLVKGTGVFACLSVALTLGVWFFASREFRGNKKVFIWCLGLIAISVLSLLGKYFIHDQHVSAGGVNFLVGWDSVNKYLIFYLYLASLGIFCVHGLYAKIKSRHNAPPASPRQEAGMIFVFAGMWFLMFLNFYAILHRYSVTVYPFIVLGGIYAVGIVLRNPLLRQWMLITVSMLALYNSYGIFYHPSYRNQHFILERSLEYRNGLKLSQLLAQRLEEQYSRFKIGAPLITAQLLAFPEFGYVTKPLDIMIYGFYCRYRGIMNYPGLNHLDISKTIYVTQADEWFKDMRFPMSDRDKIIEEIAWGDRKAFFFVGGVGIDWIWRAKNIQKLQKP